MGGTIRKWDEINGAVTDETEVPGSVDVLHQEQSGMRDDPLKNTEMQMEDDYDSIDGIINNGKKECNNYDSPDKTASIKDIIRENQEKINAANETLSQERKSKWQDLERW